MDNFNYKKYLSEGRLYEESIPSGWKKIDTSNDYEEEERQGRLMGFEAPMNGIEGDEVDNIYIEQDGDEFEVHIMTAFNNPEYKGPFNSKEEALKIAIQKMEDLKKDWDEKDLAEGKLLNEAELTDDLVQRVAQAIADEFTAEDNELDLKYVITPNSIEADPRGGGFDLDVEAGPNTPGDDWEDSRGFGIANYLGDYAGGSFVIRPEGDGYLVTNAASRNAKVAYITPEGEIEIISAEDSKADLGMTDDVETDYMERRRETSDYIEEGEEEIKKESKKPIKKTKMKKETVDSKLAEIEKQSQVVALEAKIAAIDEMIESKNQRISMVTEDDNLSQLVDKKKMKEMQREVKDLERRKAKMEKLYEKMCGKSYTKEEIVDEEMSTELNENKTKMKKSELKEMIKAAMMDEAELTINDTTDAYDPVAEAEEVDVEDNEEVDVDIEKDVEVDDESVETDIDVKGSMPGEGEDEIAVQSLLMKAQEEAEKLGDEKLTDQIGNTITYFTRAHVATVDTNESINESTVRRGNDGLINKLL